jgi:hypothetical protein
LSETVLQEAQRLVYGDREASYSPPQRDYAKTAKIWTGLLLEKLRPGVEITALEAVLMMAGMKMAREVFLHKRDNLVDAAGYIGCAGRIVDNIGMDYNPEQDDLTEKGCPQ